ncbi:MAG: DUF4198 domain-containing protein [Kofleriaceae bacterium]
MRRLVLGVWIAIASVSGTASAHDFWLYPATYDAQPGTLATSVMVGSILEVDELERDDKHIQRFEAVGPGAAIPATGVRGKKPAGYVELADPGVYSIIYQSNYNLVELEPRRFDNYLAEEGLLDIIADREKRGEADKPGRDSFSRFAKALVRVGGAHDGFDRRSGMQTELVALTDPFTGGEDGTLAFQFWYRDQPHAGSQVDLFAVARDKITLVASTKTDAEGHARFVTPGLGHFMVAATGMRRAAPPVEGDWESSWASLSFQIVSLDGAAAKPKRSRFALIAAVGTAVLLLGGWWWWKRRAKR